MREKIGFGKIPHMEEYPNWLPGVVDIEEKIDGYQCSFGADLSGNFFFHSKTRDLTQERVAIWDTAFQHVLRLHGERKILPGFTFFCEMVCKLKQVNHLYERLPKHSLLLWDVLVPCYSGSYPAPHDDLEAYAKLLDIERVPSIRVWIDGRDHYRLTEAMSLAPLLGGAKREGVVVKNRVWETPEGDSPYKVAKVVR